MTISYQPGLLYIDGKFQSGYALEVDADGFITCLGPARETSATPHRMPGRALLPGMIDVHSHSFQRALRGRAESRRRSGPDFWSWRNIMYRCALALTPEEIYDVARMAFLEMALAGITTVGEFHYLHRTPTGEPYDDPNLLAHQVIRAAQSVGIRIVLLRCAYVRAGFNLPPDAGQIRFLEPDADAFIRHSETLQSEIASLPTVTFGIAPHSVRAVPQPYLKTITDWAHAKSLPIHMHVSEQPAEIVIRLPCAEYGTTPFEFLDNLGLLTPDFTAIHAIHLHPGEIERMARGKITVGACPTTERNLGDGILCADKLIDAGVSIAFGTDSHTQTDALEQARELESNLRLTHLQRAVLDGRQGESLPRLLLRLRHKLRRTITAHRQRHPRSRQTSGTSLPSISPRHPSPEAFPKSCSPTWSSACRHAASAMLSLPERPSWNRVNTPCNRKSSKRSIACKSVSERNYDVGAENPFADLVAIPSSISSLSNEPMIERILQFFEPLGWYHRIFRYQDAAGVEKLNLIISPQPLNGTTIEAELAIVCHTDTVPYSSAWPDATTLIEREGMLHGCGACDVKGFLSCMIAAASDLNAARLSKQLCMVFTSDEEVGCRGARILVEQAALRPRYAIVGEPTSLIPSRAGKGYCLAAISVQGKAAHSAYPSVGHSAIFAAAKLIAEIERLGKELAAHRNDAFDPPYTTLNIGKIDGGTAKNIVPAECSFLVEWRPIPNQPLPFVADQLQQLATRFSTDHVEIDVDIQRMDPGFETPTDSPVIQALLGDSRTSVQTIAFGTEAPWLARMGAEAVVIGPGSMLTAHSPRECVPIKELDDCVHMLRTAIERLCK